MSGVLYQVGEEGGAEFLRLERWQPLRTSPETRLLLTAGEGPEDVGFVNLPDPQAEALALALLRDLVSRGALSDEGTEELAKFAAHPASEHEEERGA